MKKNLLVLILAVAFLMGCCVDLYVPSLPAITDYFRVNSSIVRLSVGLYMLGYAIGQLFLGILSDSFGRRKILLSGTILFTVVSLAAALAPNIYVLNVCRLIQGVTIGGVGAVARALIPDCCSEKDFAKTATLMTTAWSLGPIIGPMIGGYLQHYIGWRADFYFFGFSGLFISIYSFFVLAETKLDRTPLHLIKISSAILAMITHRLFLSFSILAALIYSIMVIFNVVGPFLIQNYLHYSVVVYGQLSLTLGFGYFLGNLLNRVLINHFKPMNIVLTGLWAAIGTIAVMILLALWVPLNFWIVIVPACLLFFAIGFIQPNVVIKLMQIFPQAAGTSSAIYGSILAGGVFIISIFASGLKTATQMPLAFMYLGILMVCLVLFFCGKK
jgi:MFS transporter, DHA1 family, multidrug resistance protein